MFGRVCFYPAPSNFSVLPRSKGTAGFYTMEQSLHTQILCLLNSSLTSRNLVNNTQFKRIKEVVQEKQIADSVNNILYVLTFLVIKNWNLNENYLGEEIDH